ncbi:MAG: hypothetical protein A3D31_04120 [Candidatus Fluviicola riflensis]|nr:MAG: hypothetical protein CHH17_10910 [Candidatus Fluviicola riflensis]OGS79163.1 MAG: hypothetical protein A3D31_04120 [Candidatus Fluviicola riflensis]OGS86595.1 MAG: hypothetical protein A2724_03580 [Fluviicola sp. RIFCSPHIGHO2_01_FULL_43_53]OGS88931.1 MAG: hypothetical protein A3E30_01080 [Fluviicola sp. RIFCSPHIGHO2_12_FULL_43_24]
MKALLSFVLLLLVTAVYAGSPSTNPNFSGSEVIKMRIQSSQVDCDGVSGGALCYSVQKESSIGKDSWETLEQSIEGFNYEAGFVYDVTVKIERVENPAPNQSPFRYILIDVISKQAD